MRRSDVRYVGRITPPLALTACALLLAACAARPGASAKAGAEAATAPSLVAATGEAVTLEELTDRALAADVVIIGEEHDNARAQALAAELWDKVLARKPEPPVNPALALEFFERDEQLVLDDYLAGVISTQRAFERDAGRTEGNYPAGHKRMLEAAKAAGRPVLAANVPRRYATYAREAGFDALEQLSPDRRAMFTIPQPPAMEEYRRRFNAVMKPMLEQHSAPAPAPPAPEGQPPDAAARARETEEKLEGLYRGQILKDATMADVVARAVEAGHGPVFLVVGRFHTDNQGGTLAYLRRRLPEADILTVSVTRAAEEEAPADVVVIAP
jgi:uncharacterized iron-regulated protein